MYRRVVITGMGCVSPNGIGNEAFTTAALAGVSGVRRITRFDASELPVQIAGEVPDFDELAWVDKKERRNVGRVLPLTIAASSYAFTDAGIDVTALPLAERQRTGVILGTGGGAQEFTEEQYRVFHSGLWKQMSAHCIPTGVMGTFSSDLSIRFGLRGASHVVTTGCTSSSDAIGYAYRQIRSGRLDAALTGGADAPIALGIMKGFVLMNCLTERWNADPQRGSRPFSADRDGFVLAEGAWMFVVEEMEHARARGAKIYAEVAGYGSTCEGSHSAPEMEYGEESARAMKLAIREAGISPENIDYANLDGRSTQLNDRMETRAVKLALGDQRARQVPMSTIKSQIGHPQGASGAAGIAATLVAMKSGQIPPTVNLDEPDPECDLDYVPEAGREVAIEHAICNSSAFGSKNSVLVLSRVA